MSEIIGGRFELEDQPFGQGAMGKVYRGTDKITGKQIAAKLLRPEISEQNPELLERFKREGEALRQLNHPNIVRMVDTVDEDNKHWLVMDYLPGGSLRDVLDERKSFTVQRVLYTALDIADALTRAHRLSILHRDIKPANVLLAEDGTPSLTDFGLAHTTDSTVTQSGVVLGTMAYLAPELFNGQPADERTDIWAYGVMLYEMLAGHRPYDSPSTAGLIMQITTGTPPDLEELRPDIPIALVDLVYRMLERDPVLRMRSVRQIGLELEAIIHSSSSSIMQPVMPLVEDGRFITQTTSQVKLQTTTIHLSNLPAQSTPFVGRARELSSLEALLNDANVRLVTILGPGGTGKTRVSVEAGERVALNYMDGAYFVPLEPLASADLVYSTIADTIGFSFAGADQQTELIDHFREKSALLVLDNFEHVMGAADFVGKLLPEAPGVKLIITSRERLRLRSEHVFELDGMQIPPGCRDEQEVESYPSVQLFLQAARHVMPDFDLEEGRCCNVVDIINAVQGMPLGIELAAGWLEMLDIAEIADEINRSIDFLETDLRDVPDRHRSLRAVFEYSWNLLGEDERNVLMKLSVFRGGFEREAAQKVTGAGLRTLTALSNKSLIQRAPDGRYTIHKLTRQFAEEHFKACEDEQAEAVYRAHAAYYGSFASKLELNLEGRMEQMAIASMEKELENVRAAWQYACEHMLQDVLMQLMQPKLLFSLARSLLQEGIGNYQGLKEMLETRGETDTDLYWRTRSRLAWISSRVGAYDVVWENAKTAYDYFRQGDNHLETVHALNNMAYAQMWLGDYDAGRKYARESIHLSDKYLSDLSGVQFSGKGHLGYLEFLAGNLDEARKIYEELRETSINNGASPISVAYGANNLGEVVNAMGEVERARELYQEAYDLFAANKHRRGMAFTLNNLGSAQITLSNFDEARALYEQAIDLYRTIGDRAGIAHSLSALGNIALYAKDTPAEARKYYQQAEEIRRDLGERKSIAESLTEIAMTHVLEGNPDAAVLLLDEAYDIGSALNQDSILTMVDFCRGNVYLQKQKTPHARAHFIAAMNRAHGGYMPFQVLLSLFGLAEVLAVHDDCPRALEILYVLQRHTADFSMARRLMTRMSHDAIARAEADTTPAEQATARARAATLTVDDLVAQFKAEAAV